MKPLAVRKFVRFLLILSILVGAQQTWALSCIELLESFNVQKTLYTSILEADYDRGAKLFLNTARTNFTNSEQRDDFHYSKLFKARDFKGRTFVFRHLQNDLEYKILRALALYEGIAPETYVVRIGTEKFLGTEKIDGLNVKEIQSYTSWRTKETQSEIEGILGKRFSSTDAAVARFASLVINHPKFTQKIARLKSIFAKLGLIPNDFQFMLFYSKETNRLIIRVIDVEKYRLTAPGRTFKDADQGFHFIIKGLEDAASTNFYSHFKKKT